jgi:hypothetical protein
MRRSPTSTSVPAYFLVTTLKVFGGTLRFSLKRFPSDGLADGESEFDRREPTWCGLVANNVLQPATMRGTPHSQGTGARTKY